MKTEVVVPVVAGVLAVAIAFSAVVLMLPAAGTASSAESTTSAVASAPPVVQPLAAPATASPSQLPVPRSFRDRPLPSGSGDPNYNDVPLSLWVKRTSDLNPEFRKIAIDVLLKTDNERRSAIRLDELIMGPTTYDALLACQSYRADQADILKHFTAAVQSTEFFPDLNYLAWHPVRRLDSEHAVLLAHKWMDAKALKRFKSDVLKGLADQITPADAAKFVRFVIEHDRYADAFDDFMIPLIAGRLSVADARSLLDDPALAARLKADPANNTRLRLQRRAGR